MRGQSGWRRWRRAGDPVTRFDLRSGSGSDESRASVAIPPGYAQGRASARHHHDRADIHPQVRGKFKVRSSKYKVSSEVRAETKRPGRIVPPRPFDFELAFDFWLLAFDFPQYIPPMPPPWPPGIGASFFSSGISETSASVVSNSEAIDEEFCSAERTTFAGSMTPALTRSS